MEYPKNIPNVIYYTDFVCDTTDRTRVVSH